MSKEISIFISSRFYEFRGLRDKIIEERFSKLDVGLNLNMLDDRGGIADVRSPAIASIEEAGYSDIFILLLGETYKEEQDGKKSYTHQEYDTAITKGLNILAFPIGNCYDPANLKLSSDDVLFREFQDAVLVNAKHITAPYISSDYDIDEVYKRIYQSLKEFIINKLNKEMKKNDTEGGTTLRIQGDLTGMGVVEGTVTQTINKNNVEADNQFKNVINHGTMIFNEKGDTEKKEPFSPTLGNPFQREEQIEIYLKNNRVISRRDVNFVGRENEIQLVLNELIEGKQYAITGVIGNGGVGKSAIANEIIHIIKDSWSEKYCDYLRKRLFVDGIMWIKLESEQTLEQVFEEQILQQLGVYLSLKNFERELHKLLLTKDILIVLDSAEQNRVIFRELMEIFTNYPILITSREIQAGINMLRVDTLNTQDSFELFKRHLNQKISQKEEEEITSFCIKSLGGLPLAIKIIANYMNISGRKLSNVKNLLNIEIDDPFRRQKVSIDSVFELSFSALTPMAQKVFIIGGVFAYPFKEEYLFEIAKKNEEVESITQEIDSLMKISLIEKNGEFYNYHPLLREYALKKLHTSAFSKEIFEAYKEYYASLSANELNLPFIYDELNFILEDDYRENNFDRFFKIVKNLDWWLVGIGFYARREKLLQRGYEKAEELKNKEKEHLFLVSYGDSLGRRGEYRKSKEYFEKALSLEYEKNRFWVYYALYTTEYKLKKYQKPYIKNLEFSRKSLGRDISLYSSFFKTNSWICNDYYQFDLALDYAKINNLVQADKSNNFKALIDLVKVYLYQTNYKKSLTYIEKLEEYNYDINIDVENKIELKILKAWVFLYKKEQTLLNLITDIENRFKLLGFGNTAYDTLREIEMLYYIQQTNWVNAKLSLEKIRDEEEKEFALGIYNSYQDIAEAQNIFEEYLTKEKLSPEEIARTKLYLSFVYVKQNKNRQAIELLCDAQNIYKSYMNPIEKEIEKEIIWGVGIDEFIEIKSTTRIEKQQF